MEFLANLIYFLHSLLVLFYILAPFSDIPGFLTLHITLSMSLFTHWYFNNSACCLTILESSLRGVSSDDTFIHRLVSPIYNIPETSLNTIVYIVSGLLFGVSLYKLIIHLLRKDTLSIDTFLGLKKIEI